MSGFFGGKTQYIKEYIQKNKSCFVSEGYKVLFDILKHSKNIKIEEIDYTFQERMGGKSKIGSKHVFAFFKSLLN